MEQIKLVFFALASFFTIENGQIGADKTTVAIYPKTQEIEVIQEGLFTVIQSAEDSTRVLEQIDKLQHWEEKKTAWTPELEHFPVKNFTFMPFKDTIQARLKFTYTNEKDLRPLGIWYNVEKNQFSINHNSHDNIKTKDGKLDGNYWVFNGEREFRFTLEPFLKMPEKHKKSKTPIQELLRNSKTDN